ncbi:MAG: prepilin-type N-terminal cleavage/methylation domain-containing protein [Methylococcales bacterium]|nr:prepilin-type N-terminal cleavage/methylation domain-containing protein [Methylococcales bacterium]
MLFKNKVNKVRQPGFSLIELLVTMSIITTTASMSVSPLNHLYQQSKIDTAVDSFSHSLQLARSEAIKNRQKIIMCPLSKSFGNSCANNSIWNHGWLIYIDSNSNKKLDDKDIILKRVHLSANINITSSASRKRVIYRSIGMSPGSNTTVTFCDPQANISPSAVILSNTGRPRFSKTKPSGSNLICL